MKKQVTQEEIERVEKTIELIKTGNISSDEKITLLKSLVEDFFSDRGVPPGRIELSRDQIEPLVRGCLSGVLMSDPDFNAEKRHRETYERLVSDKLKEWGLKT